MSTLALWGLLVVVLVAVGIAAFLRWGRSRDGYPTSHDDERPRTVADLVDRRARGLDDPPAELRPDDDVDPRPEERPEAEAGEIEDPAPPPRPAVGPTVSSAPDISEVRDDEVLDDEVLDDEVLDDGVRDDVPADAPAPVAVGERDVTEEIPEVRPDSPRITPDVSSGPVGPPWSRGFKDGKPVEPVERPAPRPTPSPRPSPRPAAEPVADDDTQTGPGPVSSAPDISAPRDAEPSDVDRAGGQQVTGEAAAAAVPGAAATDPETASTESPTTGAALLVGAGAATEHTTTDTPAGADEASTGADETGADETRADRSVGVEPAVPTTADRPDPAGTRPAAPPRAETRAPVDPDLVKRVTALPVDRSGNRIAATPDTEREFREARDRISGQPVWRVPEQAGASEPTARPTPFPRPEQATEDGDTDPDDTDPDDATPGTRPGAVRGATAPAASAAAGVAGVAAVSRFGSRGAPSEEDERAGRDEEATEPPPRPAPRVLRSARPAGGPPPPPNVGTGGPPPATGPGTSDTGPVDPSRRGATAGQPEETAPPVTSATAVPGRTARPDLEDTVVFTAVRPGPEPAAVVPDTAPQEVEVRVLGQDGEPLVGADIALRDRTGQGLATATTGTDGVTGVTAPGSGQYVLVATSAGHCPGVTACSVADGPATAALTLHRSAAVHGTVRRASGAAVTQLPVAVEQDGAAVAAARTDDDGAFRITDLDAGWYRVVAEVDGAAVGLSVQVPAGAEVACDLTGGTGS